MLVEVKLDLLIGDVDAELLERVLLEVLKTEDVQDADVQALVILSGGEKNEKSVCLNHSCLLVLPGGCVLTPDPRVGNHWSSLHCIHCVLMCMMKTRQRASGSVRLC